MNAVTAFAPATVSNVACGFDVLGFALEEPGEHKTIRGAEHLDELLRLLSERGIRAEHRE